MKGTTFASIIRKDTGTDAVSFPDADLLLYANIVKDELAEMIENEVDEGYFEIALTRDLVANQREYAFDSNLLLAFQKNYIKINGKYVLMEEIDQSQYDGGITEEEIKENFSLSTPRFVITGRGMKIYTGTPIEDVTDGLKMIGNIYPEDLTATDLAGSYDLSIPQDPNADQKHAMPRATHTIWANMVSRAYKLGRDKPMKLSPREEQLDQIFIPDLMSKLRDRNKDRSFVPSTPNVSGFEY